MLIGLDFDNTIVSYDSLFHRVALEQSLIPSDLEVSKIKIRDYLRNQDNEDAWTEMQGYVYGARMEEAEAFPGVIAFMQWARAADIELVIISHKTKHPFIGEQYDLHAAARSWIDANLIQKSAIVAENIYFELTKEEKIKKIETVRCNYFIDDLPEILNAINFPSTTNKILFDPVDNHESGSGLVKSRNWEDIKCLFQQALTSKA